MTALLERMETKIIRTPGGCWRWVGELDRDGYGRVNVGNQGRGAHRVMLIELGTVFAPGMQVDHLCRNRACVNPMHLDVVTARVNSLRSASPPAVNATKIRCIRGHEFTPENTRIEHRKGRRPTRACRACNRAAVAQSKARRLAAAAQDGETP